MNNETNNTARPKRMSWSDFAAVCTGRTVAPSLVAEMAAEMPEIADAIRANDAEALGKAIDAAF